MEYEVLKKSLTPEELAVVEAEIAKAKAEVPAGFMSPEDKKKMEDEKAAAEVAKTAAEGEVAKMKTELETLKKSATGETEEDILKSADLSPAIRAILESNIAKAKAAEVVVLKMQEVAETAEFIAKAKEVAFIPEADTKVVEFLKSIKGVKGADEQLMEILKSANTLISKGGALGEVGTTNQGSANNTNSEAAWACIEKAANELVAKGTVTKAKSIEMVMNSQPALYKTYVDALRSE